MNFQSVAYTVFTLLLAAVFAGIVLHYYNPGRKKEVEEPKYRMLLDDEEEPQNRPRKDYRKPVPESPPDMSEPELPQESANRIPGIWLVLFTGVIIFLLWYIASYTPAISGWSFYREFEKKRIAGGRTVTATATGKYLGNPTATAEGKSIFETNCAPCHNADASGGIGPNLKSALRYGSTPDQLYETISKGRPNGMPPFRQQLGDEHICKIIAFLESIRS
jgi:cytochrome c oxidase cbb3-type subunit 3